MLKIEETNATWTYITKNNKKMFISGVYWNWHPRDPNAREFFNDDSGYGTTLDHSPIVPVLAVVMLAITVFLLVLFRQNPGLVAGTVAGCLIVIGMYLTLNSIQENKLKFE